MTYTVVALVLAAVTIPAHAFALKAPWPAAPPRPPHTGHSATAVTRSRPFWMLAAALTLSAFTVFAVVVALVPLLIERGYSTTQAAWALGLGVPPVWGAPPLDRDVSIQPSSRVPPQ